MLVNVENYLKMSENLIFIYSSFYVTTDKPVSWQFCLQWWETWGWGSAYVVVFFLFGTDSTSALPGNVRPDEGQRPLNMLFLPILLSLRGHPEVGKKEGELPAGLVDVLTAVHSVGQGLCAVLCPQAEGSQRRERRGEQMVARLVLKLNFWVSLSVMSKSAVWFF